MAEESDDEDDRTTTHNSHTDSEYEDEGEDGHGAKKQHAGSQDNSDPDSEGLLPRDKQKKTAFYDPVAERQMTQTDAKLFYMRSQQRTGTGNWDTGLLSDQGSPVISASGASHAADKQYGQLPPSYDLGSSNAWSGAHGQQPAAFDNASRKDTSFFNASSARSQASNANPAYAPPAQCPSAPDPLYQAQLEMNSGAPNGIGSSTYMDADPQITAELSSIFKNIQKILDVRHKYMRCSLQGPTDNPKDDPAWSVYPPPPQPAWMTEHDRAATGTQARDSANNSMANSMVMDSPQRPNDASADQFPQAASKKKGRRPGEDIGEDFDMKDLHPLPGPGEMTYKLDAHGVYQVFENEAAKEADTPAVTVPTIREYYMDLEAILSVSSDGPSKSFAYRRLQYLEGKYNLYVLLNEYQETADSKKVPHRDFYNVRKVDTHVHHSACMNQKHLLRFIKSKMKKFPNEVVLYRDDKHLTLAEVFESINLTAYDLSIDTLDMHVSLIASLEHRMKY